MKIYLAGNLPKGDEEEKSFENWRVKYARIIGQYLEAEFIDPFERGMEVSEGDALAIFGLDCMNIKESDLVVVNAEIQLGAGTAQEMVIAKYFGKPVITILPKDTFHRRSNLAFRGEIIEDWIHPFINSFSDAVLVDIEEFDFDTERLAEIQPKDISIIDEAIKYIGKMREKV